MSKDTTKKAAAPAPEAKAEKKRTILTPEQRIAKLKAEAAALEAKVKDKAKGKLAEADARVQQLREQVAARQAKLDEAIAERDALKVQAGEDSTPVES